jgi:hypothetical protein
MLLAMTCGHLAAAAYSLDPALKALRMLPCLLRLPSRPQGLKFQNRAVEGDEVAIRILPPTEWYQLGGSGGNKAAGAGASSAATPSPTSSAAGAKSNVVPLPARLAGEAAGVPPTPLTAAVGAAPAAMTPPAWAGLEQQQSQQRRPMGDLMASPALLPSGGVVWLTGRPAGRQAAVVLLSVEHKQICIVPYYLRCGLCCPCSQRG